MGIIFITGIFSYVQAAPGGATIQYVNCTLAIDLNPNVNFPLKLLLLVTGVVLVATDINLSILFCLLKYCGCGGLAVIWYLLECLILTTWSAWSIFYIVTIFPLWQDTSGILCERFVFISTSVAVAVVSLCALFYLSIILIVVIYEVRERMGCRHCCCHRPKYRDDD